MQSSFVPKVRIDHKLIFIPYFSEPFAYTYDFTYVSYNIITSCVHRISKVREGEGLLSPNVLAKSWTYKEESEASKGFEREGCGAGRQCSEYHVRGYGRPPQ